MTTSIPPARSPWLHIWAHPRDTIRDLFGRSPLYVELLLVSGSGVIQSMVQSASNHVGHRAPGFIILPATLVIGSAWGLLQLHLIATVLFLVGKWTGTPAPFAILRTALSWAAVPQVAILPFWVVGTLVFGRFLYVEPEFALARMPLAALAQGLLMLGTLVVCVWWLVLQVVTVAEAQRVSVWRALGNYAVGGLMFGVAVLVIVVPFVMLARGR